MFGWSSDCGLLATSLGDEVPLVYRLALCAPEGDSEADHGDTVRVGQQAVEGVRHQRERGADEAADREEDACPPGEDVGAEERDAEEHPAGQVAEALEFPEGTQGANVTGDGAAKGAEGDEVLDVAGVGSGDGGRTYAVRNVVHMIRR